MFQSNLSYYVKYNALIILFQNMSSYSDLVQPPDPQAHSAVCETNQYFKHKSLHTGIYMHVSGQKDFK